ncbi:MAG: hydrolase 2, exosortase A system-associated [Methylomonas sp.]|nr:MAG: hydrolase 2, exosortase A system-associated [Methylomonas sp.]
MIPFFLESCAGPLFAVYWPPANQSIKHAVLHVPAFAEEMNKSRRMVALQARAMADQGCAVLVLDLFGTGDSSGDFGEANWAIWLQNIADAVAWLKQQGARTATLWGLRLGALLAMDFVNRHEHSIDRLMLWQPVLNGDTSVTQFLRLRVAAAMMNNNMPKETTSDLKRQLLDGIGVEVAGYRLHPELIKPLIALRADRLSLCTVKEIALFEVLANADTPVSMPVTQFFSALQETPVKVSLTKSVGDSFWANQEITEAQDLIELSCEWVKQWQ